QMHPFQLQYQTVGGPLRQLRRCRSRQVLPNYRAPGSWPAFIAVALPLGPVETAEFALLRTLADSTYCRPRLLTVETGLHRHQPRDFLTVAGDGDFLAALDLVEQLAELVFGLKSTDFAHFGVPRSQAGLS